MLFPCGTTKCQWFFLYVKHLKKIYIMYLKGNLCPSISLLENGRDIMPTPQWWEGNLPTYSFKDPPTIEE
jgi:hypothetical protein